MKLELQSLSYTSSIVQQLSPETLSKLVELGQEVTIEPGQYLFREGETNHFVYVVLAGKVDLKMSVPGRPAKRILSLAAGELVAWSSLLGEGEMTCSAICLEPTRLMAVDSREIDKLVREDLAFGFEFMRMLAKALAKRLVATRIQLLDLFASPSESSSSTV